jgi:beta-glucanase (GH16 family)
MARLLWEDRFQKSGSPDLGNWRYETGGHGWGNNELQFYTDRKENARIENKRLIIEARKEAFEGKRFTSARLASRKAWRYGRFEVVAKLPSGLGTWPAIWMLPEPMGQWPRCGELDIMEHVGYDPGRIHHTVHCEAFNHMKGSQKGANHPVPDFDRAFHTYAMDWRASKITFFVDGKERFVFEKLDGATEAEWPFDKPFAFRLNLAVGGNWGGAKGIDEGNWPRRLEIRSVRVFA